jgi:membrane associated rhomboid family serine protease
MFSDRNYNRYNSSNNYYHAVPILIMINVIVFLLQNLTQNISTFGFFRDAVTFYFSLNGYFVVQDFQIWRIVSYMFLHGGFFHILLNMWGLYLFGTMLEQNIGSTKFLILYFISGIAGALLWIVFNLNSIVPCVGASAALFGVMVAAAMMYPDAMIMLMIPPIPLKLKTFVIVYALIETFASVGGMQGGVAHLAHIGGLIGGYIYMRIAFPKQIHDIFGFIKNIFGGGRSSSGSSGYQNSTKASKKWKFTNSSSGNLDEILDKISRSGINSLSDKEMDVLRKARDKMRKN